MCYKTRGPTMRKHCCSRAEKHPSGNNRSHSCEGAKAALCSVWRGQFEEHRSSACRSPGEDNAGTATV